MRYEYTYRTTGFELWQLSMYYTYGSMVGVCNVVFTGAMLVLMISKWSTANGMMKLLMVLGLSLFTVIQPYVVYLRAKKQVSHMEQDTAVCFEDNGIHVRIGDQSSDIRWTSIKKISKKPTLIILFSDTTHGFVLTNRVLGEEREAFYAYITSKIKSV